ncbi:MAG: peptide deformylase [Gemmatimonadetes bacterium]|nr:peptide deformylase [Gemmatimonadota bacterium]
MSILPVHLLGSAVLRERAKEVGAVDAAVRHLVDDLRETMHAYRGVGLAANQVGLTRRVAVVETEPGDLLALIDPKIVESTGQIDDEEGCLSIPDLYGDVRRAARVVVETTAFDGQRVRVEALDLKSRAIQHEIDHLDGILFLDRLSLLKRQLMLRKWRKSRKGETSVIREVPETADEA